MVHWSCGRGNYGFLLIVLLPQARVTARSPRSHQKEGEDMFDIDKVFWLFEEICKHGNATIKDFTKKGHCSHCGGCCSNLLPLAKSEIESIKQYVLEHNISVSPRDDGSCLFLTPKNECSIYEARPLICRLFKCSRLTPTFKDGKLLNQEDRELVSIRQAFSELINRK